MKRALVPLAFALLLPACVQDDPASPFHPQMGRIGTNSMYTRWYNTGESLTWDQANAAAENLEDSGYSDWHLVVITSASENATVNALIPVETNWCVIGLYQQGGKEPAGGWKWVTHEKLTYKNWDANQPDDTGDWEDLGVMNRSSGWWFDAAPTTLYNCYIAERNY